MSIPSPHDPEDRVPDLGPRNAPTPVDPENDWRPYYDKDGKRVRGIEVNRRNRLRTTDDPRPAA